MQTRDYKIAGLIPPTERSVYDIKPPPTPPPPCYHPETYYDKHPDQATGTGMNTTGGDKALFDGRTDSQRIVDDAVTAHNQGRVPMNRVRELEAASTNPNPNANPNPNPDFDPDPYPNIDARP